LGDAEGTRVGQLVIAVGNPHGVRGAATLGIISAVGTKGPQGPGARRNGRREVVQADITLAPGNSGGPLTDTAGRVIGINAMVAGPRVALAVPVHVARRFMAGETPSGARIGVLGQAAVIPLAWRREGIRQEAGVILVGIQEDGPAAHAGLLPGDVLLALDGTALESPDALLDVLDAHTPGVPLQATLLRGGQLRGVTVIPDAA
jgi:S1-C subfamily serine protease